jgi:arylformamidase
MPRIYDITRTVTPALAVWPGDTPFAQTWVSRMERGDSVNVTALTLSPHTGTHADAPLHYNTAGLCMGEAPLDVYIGRATLVVIETTGVVTPAHLAGIDLHAIERLLIKTPASLRPTERWDEEFAYLAPETAALLGESGVRLFGTDAPSVDHMHSKTLDAHHTLDRYNVYILESLALAEVPPGDYELIAPPLKVMVDGSPVRALLRTLV